MFSILYSIFLFSTNSNIYISLYYFIVHCDIMIWLLVPSLLIAAFAMSIILVTKKDNRIILWPEYFDGALPKNRGRRVPKKLAIHSPTLEEIAKAAKRLKLNPKIEKHKAYPRHWWRHSGRVLVQAKTRKTKIIRQVAIVIKKYRK